MKKIMKYAFPGIALIIAVCSPAYAEELFVSSEFPEEIQAENDSETEEWLTEDALTLNDDLEDDAFLDEKINGDLNSDLYGYPESDPIEEISLDETVFPEDDIFLEDDIFEMDELGEDVCSEETTDFLEEDHIDEEIMNADKAGEYYGGVYFSDRVKVVLNKTFCYVSSWDEDPRPDVTVYFDGRKLNNSEWEYFNRRSGPGEYYAFVSLTKDDAYKGKSSTKYKAIAKGHFDIKFVDMVAYPHKTRDSLEVVYSAKYKDLLGNTGDYQTLHKNNPGLADWSYPYINVYWDGKFVDGDAGELSIENEKDFIDREYDLGKEGFNVGTKKVAVTGKSLFAGCSGEKEYKILPYKGKLINAKGGDVEYPYTGKEITLSLGTKDLRIVIDEPYVTNSLMPGSSRSVNYFTQTRDCYIAGYKNNVQPGTATVILKGKGNYEGSYGEATFHIYKPFTVTIAKTVYEYSGKKIMPKITVKDGNKVLTSSDYTVDYHFYSAKDYIVPGLYNCTIIGKGIYAGVPIFKQIRIVTPTASISSLSQEDTGSFRLRWTRSAKSIEGVNVWIATDPEFKNNLRKYTVTDKDEYLFRGYEPGTYYVQVRGWAAYDGIKYYSEWSSAKTINLKSSSGSTAAGGTSTESVSKSAPRISKVFNSQYGGDIRWQKVNGAAGYAVYSFRSAEGTKKVATINDVNTLQCYDTSIRYNCYGRVYSYYVKALYKENGKNVEGPASERLELQRLAPMQIISAVNNTGRKIALKWKCTVDENKAYGYEIHYAQSSDDLNGRKGTFRTLTVNGRNSLSAEISNLSQGRTYWIRMRCYVNYTNSVTGKQTKTWSQFSNTVKVTIKK